MISGNTGIEIGVKSLNPDQVRIGKYSRDLNTLSPDNIASKIKKDSSFSSNKERISFLKGLKQVDDSKVENVVSQIKSSERKRGISEVTGTDRPEEKKAQKNEWEKDLKGSIANYETIFLDRNVRKKIHECCCQVVGSHREMNTIYNEAKPHEDINLMDCKESLEKIISKEGKEKGSLLLEKIKDFQGVSSKTKMLDALVKALETTVSSLPEKTNTTPNST